MRKPEFCTGCSDRGNKICPLPSFLVRLGEGLVDSSSHVTPADAAAGGAYHTPSEVVVLANHSPDITRPPTRKEQRAERIAACAEMHQSLKQLMDSLG